MYNLTVIDELYAASSFGAELIVVEKTVGFYDAVIMNGPFEVDGIPYDQDDAEHEIRPMIQLFPDGEGSTLMSRWRPIPVSEAEMREFIHSGMLDGVYQG